MNAFGHWIVENYKDEGSIAGELYAQTLLYQNPQVAGILEKTGDKGCTKETFSKAARILLQEKEEQV